MTDCDCAVGEYCSIAPNTFGKCKIFSAIERSKTNSDARPMPKCLPYTDAQLLDGSYPEVTKWYNILRLKWYWPPSDWQILFFKCGCVHVQRQFIYWHCRSLLEWKVQTMSSQQPRTFRVSSTCTTLLSSINLSRKVVLSDLAEKAKDCKQRVNASILEIWVRYYNTILAN